MRVVKFFPEAQQAFHAESTEKSTKPFIMSANWCSEAIFKILLFPTEEALFWQRKGFRGLNENAFGIYKNVEISYFKKSTDICVCFLWTRRENFRLKNIPTEFTRGMLIVSVFFIFLQNFDKKFAFVSSHHLQVFSKTFFRNQTLTIAKKN